MHSLVAMCPELNATVIHIMLHTGGNVCLLEVVQIKEHVNVSNSHKEKSIEFMDGNFVVWFKQQKYFV